MIKELKEKALKATPGPWAVAFGKIIERSKGMKIFELSRWKWGVVSGLDSFIYACVIPFISFKRGFQENAPRGTAYLAKELLETAAKDFIHKKSKP